MFGKWMSKWKVGPLQFTLILCTFAVTGTLTAWISRQAPGWVGLEPDDHWAWRALLRLVVLIFGYQVIILLVALPFGQFPFFWAYEKKILRRFGFFRDQTSSSKGQASADIQ